MNRYNEPVDVWTAGSGDPVRFVFRRRTYEVQEVLERWKWAGKWWELGAAQRRFYFRVMAKRQDSESESTFTLYSYDGVWVLESSGG